MGKRKFINLISFISLIAIASSAILLSSSLFSQEIDPFYLKLLTRGEKSFLAQNYKEAAKELEIAAFGLHREKKLKAKALVYLSMCYYYLKDMENCENYLRQVSELVGREEIANLEKEIDESVRFDFQKLLNHFKLAPEEEKEVPLKIPEKAEAKTKPPEQKARTKTQIRDKARVERDPVKNLERNIKARPRNVSLYYELYKIHIRNSNSEL